MRLPGSGGANDLASFCWRTLIVMKHDAKKFVEKLDFLTTPGYLTGPGRARPPACPRRPGRTASSPTCACWTSHPDTRRMRVKSLHPGKTLEQVQAATGFELEACDPLGTTVEPNEQQLCILRSEVGPRPVHLRGGRSISI